MELNHLKLNTSNFPNIKTANFQTIEDKIILTYEKLNYLLDFLFFSYRYTSSFYAFKTHNMAMAALRHALD